MTTVVLSPSKRLKAGAYQFDPVEVPEEAKRLRISLTREAWAKGPGGHIFLTYPGGHRSHLFSFAGGVHIDRLGNLVDVSSAEFTIEQDGLPADIPAGLYIVELELRQALTTSVQFEWS